MKDLAKTLVILLCAGCLASCNDDDSGTGTGTDAGTDEMTSISVPDFTSFAISQSTTATGETAASPTSRSQSVTITFADGAATVTSGDASLVSITGEVVTASTDDVNYILQGTATSGSANFNCKATGAFTITLAGLNVTSYDKAIQAKKGGSVTLVVQGGTTNTLKTYGSKTIEIGNDKEGSEIEQALDIYGSGILNLESVGYTDDNNEYQEGKGAISSTGDMTINPGVVLNVTTSQAGKKSIKSDTSIDFKGGRTTIINNAPAEWDTEELDYSAATCVKAPAINISGGTVQCYATGNGGKGIRADETMTVTDGTVEVITTGKNLVRDSDADKVVELAQLDNYSSYKDANPKGIHVGDKDANPATGKLTISGGKVKVKATNSEGIESKMYINISGGTVESYAGDDGMNAGISSENNKGNAYAGKGQVNISGGTVFAYSVNNDAIDANGTISISGGVVVASGNTAPECGIDCDQNTFAITGGYVIGLGGDTSSPTESACTQSSLITSASVSAGDVLTLQIGGSTVLRAEMPRSYNGARLLVSSPQMKKGTSYAILINGNESSGTLSSSSYVNGSSGSGMGGGTFPGGGGGFPGGRP